MGKNGETPLMLSAKQNNKEVVRLLLQYGANKELKNLNGQTALDIEINYNNIDIITLINKPQKIGHAPSIPNEQLFAYTRV